MMKERNQKHQYSGINLLEGKMVYKSNFQGVGYGASKTGFFQEVFRKIVERLPQGLPWRLP